MPCIQSGTNPSTRPLNLVVSHSPISTGATPVPAITVQETPTKELEAGEKEESSLKQINTDPQSHVQAASGSTESSGHIDHRKFGVLASPEHQTSLTKMEKKALDKNILGAIQSHLAPYFQWTEEEAHNNFKKEPMNIQQKIADKCQFFSILPRIPRKVLPKNPSKIPPEIRNPRWDPNCDPCWDPTWDPTFERDQYHWSHPGSNPGSRLGTYLGSRSKVPPGIPGGIPYMGKGCSFSLCSLMLSFQCFDFRPCGIQKEVKNTLQFLKVVDSFEEELLTVF
ncbi:hypothetical protein ACROYT_G021832 [Oculina patagonica]